MTLVCDIGSCPEVRVCYLHSQISVKNAALIVKLQEPKRVRQRTSRVVRSLHQVLELQVVVIVGEAHVLKRRLARVQD